MARLLKFAGTQSLPGVGNPQVIADTAVGEAVAGVGRQIGNSMGQLSDLADLADRRQRQVDDYESEKAAMEVSRRLKGNLSQEIEVERPGGIGLTEAMLVHLTESRDEAQKGLTEEAKVRFNQKFEAERERYMSSFAAVEAAENEKYFRRGMGELEDQLVAEVQDDPEAIDAAFERADATLMNMPLPGGVKTRGLDNIKEKLAEAWTKSRPVQEQIDGLTKLKTGRDAVASAGTAGKRPAGAAPETGSAAPPGFEDRVQFLAPHTQNRLLADALKEKAAAAVQEEERIAALIAENPLAMNPQEVNESGFLEAHQQKRLLDNLLDRVEQQEKDLDAVSWVGSSGTDQTNAGNRQELVDRAFAYLDDGRTDRDVLALGILRSKGVLPITYLKSLAKELKSSDPVQVSTAFDILSELAGTDPGIVSAVRGVEKFRNGIEKRDLLVSRLGFSRKDAAAELALGNDPVRRKGFQSDFSAQYPQGRIGQARDRNRLGQLSVNGYASSTFPINELLHGVDFIERNDGDVGEFQVAGKLPRSNNRRYVARSTSRIFYDQNVQKLRAFSRNKAVLTNPDPSWVPSRIDQVRLNISLKRARSEVWQKIHQATARFSEQKQHRHVMGGRGHKNGSYFNNMQDARTVFEALRKGKISVLGQTANGYPVFRFNGVTGFHNDARRGVWHVPTNIYYVKGTSAPSIVPYRPNWGY